MKQNVQEEIVLTREKTFEDVWYEKGPIFGLGELARGSSLFTKGYSGPCD